MLKTICMIRINSNKKKTKERKNYPITMDFLYTKQKNTYNRYSYLLVIIVTSYDIQERKIRRERKSKIYRVNQARSRREYSLHSFLFSFLDILPVQKKKKKGRTAIMYIYIYMEFFFFYYSMPYKGIKNHTKYYL